MHAVDEDGCLRGVARLVTLVQADPDAALIEVCDTDPVRVGADTDITDVAVLMTDYNLITIPVVDDRRRLLGVITVDDVLEIALPADWRRREAAPPRHPPGPFQPVCLAWLVSGCLAVVYRADDPRCARHPSSAPRLAERARRSWPAQAYALRTPVAVLSGGWCKLVT